MVADPKILEQTFTSLVTRTLQVIVFVKYVMLNRSLKTRVRFWPADLITPNFFVIYFSASSMSRGLYFGMKSEQIHFLQWQEVV